MYEISITKHALKEMISLPTKASKQLALAIDELADEPRPKGCKKLKGEKEYLWRVRVGDYRIIYQIDDVIKIIEIRKVGHRKNIYD